MTKQKFNQVVNETSKEKYIHAVHPEEQFDNCCKEQYVEKAALMADGHTGYTSPIGAVYVTKEYVVPAIVGFDIGCGATTINFNDGDAVLALIKYKAKEIFEKIKTVVPMGVGKLNTNEHEMPEWARKEMFELIDNFKKGPYDASILQFIYENVFKHLGTLGSGNHFIEVGESEDKEGWITIHSGSRGIGYHIGQYYMKKAANKDKQYEGMYAFGIYSELGKEYLNSLNFCLEFALLNRRVMIDKVVKAMEEVTGSTFEYNIWVNKNHNHAVPYDDNGRYIHRKGATASNKGERGVIMASMKDGVFLVEGKGHPEFLESSSHGAGRKMGRNVAKNNITMEEFEKSMEGIVGTISKGTLDEAPQAYKNPYEVMEAQKDSVTVIRQLKPVINWKGEGKNGK